MSTKSFPAVHAEAIQWHIRLRDERAGEWEAFTDWLALDPRHSEAYDEVALGDTALRETLTDWSQSTAVRTNDNAPMDPPVRSRRLWFAGGGLAAAAAAAAALLLVAPIGQPKADYYDIATAPGEHRIVTLRERDTIALNGGSVIRLDRHNPRFVSLTTGEAAFNVTHDARSPFTLSIGDDRLVDVGTRFNVVRTAVGHRVDVAEGSVLYNPDSEKIALAAGQSLTSRTGERRIVVANKPVAEIGGWQRGRLSYRSAPLTEVAADLARNLGTSIAVQPAIASRSFTGTIEIDRNEDRMFARLSQLLDVDARRGARGWTLGPGEGAPR